MIDGWKKMILLFHVIVICWFLITKIELKAPFTFQTQDTASIVLF